MKMKKNKMILNNFILDHAIRIDDEVIEYIQDYIYWEQNISARTDHEKNQKNNRNEMKCFW